MKKKILVDGLKYGIGIGVLTYMVWSYWEPANGQVGLSNIWNKHVVQGEPIHWAPFLLAGLICLVSVLITFVRWYILVRAQGLPFTLSNAMRLGLIGYFLSNVLPGSIGGDIIKAAFIAREQSRRTVAVATVLIDRAVGLWGLCWLVVLLGGYYWLNGSLEGPAGGFFQSIITSFGMIVGLSVLVWTFLGMLPERRAHRFAGRLSRIPKVGHSAAEFWRAIWMYRGQTRSVVLALLLALIGHIGFVVTFYFASLTLFDRDQVPTLAECFLIIPVGMAIQAIPMAPGGLGIGEAGFAWLFKKIGYAEVNGFSSSMVQRVLTWILSLAGYFIFLGMRPELKKAEARKRSEHHVETEHDGKEAETNQPMACS